MLIYCCCYIMSYYTLTHDYYYCHTVCRIISEWCDEAPLLHQDSAAQQRGSSSCSKQDRD